MPRTFAEQAAEDYERSIAHMRAWRPGDVPVAVRLVQFGTIVRDERFEVDWPR